MLCIFSLLDLFSEVSRKLKNKQTKTSTLALVLWLVGGASYGLWVLSGQSNGGVDRKKPMSLGIR